MYRSSIIKVFYFVCIFFISFYIFSGSVLNSDDIYFNFFTLPEIKLDIDFFYGTWIMKFQNFLLYYLPYKFDIHFQTWAMTFGSCFISLIITGFIFFFSKFIKKDESISFFIFNSFMSFLVFFVLLNNTSFVDFLLYSGFFRFTFPSFLLIVFLSYFYLFIKREWNNLFVLLFLSFVVSASSELVAPIIMCVSFFSLVYYSIKLKKENSFSLKKVWPYFLTLFASFIGFSSLFFTLGFQQHLQCKVNISYFDNLIQSLMDFSVLYFNNLILDYSIYHILILFFIIYLLMNNKFNILKEDILYSLFIIFSIFISAFSLFFLGKASYQSNFWLDHTDIYTVYSSIFVLPFVILFSNFMYSLSFKVNIKNLFICLFLFILFSHFCALAKDIKYSVGVIRDHLYLRDKVFLFYFYKNMQPKFSDVLLHRTAWILRGDFPLPESQQYKDFYYDVLITSYFPICYKIDAQKTIPTYSFLSRDELLSQFLADGGNYSEVEAKSYKFENLWDKDFVLNCKN